MRPYIKGMLSTMLDLVLPKPSLKKVEKNYHTRMETQGPDGLLMALLFFQLGRLRYQTQMSEGTSTNTESDAVDIPEQVTHNILTGLGQGLTLVHFSAQLKRFLRDRGYIEGIV